MLMRDTIRHLLTAATHTLMATSSTSRLDAEILLSHVLNLSRAQLLAASNEVPDTAQVAAFLRLLERRVNDEPVAYLVGHREFYGLDLLVDTRVLIPRPETELLVELAIERARAMNICSDRLRIVDVGTGSGAIALALAAQLPQATIYATDTSLSALEVATANCECHGFQERIRLLQGDLLAPLPEPTDLIVSNPPYTILSEIESGVFHYEPHLALDGGSDGLHLYRRLLAQAPCWLRPGGALLLEIGATQAGAVIELIQAVFPKAHSTIYRDLAGHARVVVAEQL
jgi:release factor glutamine methyltransferase